MNFEWNRGVEGRSPRRKYFHKNETCHLSSSRSLLDGQGSAKESGVKRRRIGYNPDRVDSTNY